MIRLPPRSTPLYSSAASDVYKRQDDSPAYAGAVICVRTCRSDAALWALVCGASSDVALGRDWCLSSAIARAVPEQTPAIPCTVAGHRHESPQLCSRAVPPTGGPNLRLQPVRPAIEEGDLPDVL